MTQLQYALAHRPDTEHVVGMIMLAASCDAGTAWSKLSLFSQHANLRVRDIAQQVSARVGAGHGLPADLVTALVPNPALESVQKEKPRRIRTRLWAQTCSVPA